MSRNHSVNVQISTQTNQDVAPGSTIRQDTQFVVTNGSMSDEQVSVIMAWITEYMGPQIVEGIIDTPIVI